MTERSLELAQETSPPVAGPGVRLRAAREAQGLSVHQVADRLRLRVDIIEALERDTREHLPAPVFVAGYLRAYAKLVEVPVAEVSPDDGSTTGVQVPMVLPDKPPAGARVLRRMDAPRVAPLWWGVAAAVLAVALWLLLPREAAKVVANPQRAIVSEIDAPPVADAEPAPEASAPVVTAAEPVGESSADPVSELVLRFTDESWAEVYDATGQRLLYKLARPGSSERVVGVAPFNARIGHVAAVSMEYNGKPIDLSAHTEGRTAQISVGATGDARVAR